LLSLVSRFTFATSPIPALRCGLSDSVPDFCGRWPAITRSNRILAPQHTPRPCKFSNNCGMWKSQH
jgi:hypothetical protein